MLPVFSVSRIVLCVCVIFALCSSCVLYPMLLGVRRGRDHMVVGFTTTRAISVYHHLSCEFEYCARRGILDTPLCDKVCQ